MAGLWGLFLLWLVAISKGPIDTGEEAADYLLGLVILALFFLFSIPAAIAMIFWGGADFEAPWRRFIDKFLPAALIIVAYVLLQAL
ncbi:MAG: hypothetical protein AAFQ34_04660 [Pseudomonadota bacterium]